MSDVSDRNARLDELQQAVDQWLAAQTTLINNIITSQQQLLADHRSWHAMKEFFSHAFKGE